MEEDALVKAKRTWAQGMGEKASTGRQRAGQSNDFELTVRGLVKANHSQRIRKLIERMISVRGLEAVRVNVSGSAYEDIILREAGDLL